MTATPTAKGKPCPKCYSAMEATLVTLLVHGSKPPRYVSMVRWLCSSCGYSEQEKD